MLVNKKTVKLNISVARNRITAHPYRRGKTVDIEMFLPLAEMAAADIAPDGTFSDAECLLWEAMRYVINLSKEN